MNREEKIAAVFNEWIRQFAENPENFKPLLDDDGKPYLTYGQNASKVFDEISIQLHGEVI